MPAPESTATLLAVLSEVHDALAASEWDGAFGQRPAEVAADVRSAGRALRAGHPPGAATALFLPTGDLQEVAIANGWGEAFLDLARRADAAA